MAFGQQMGSLKNLKKSMAKGSGSFIKYVPKNGSLNVRFIQEPEHWVNYVEHYDQVARKSFPCNGEQNCPGCTGGERKSSRYLANAVDRDNNDRVIPLQLPKDLANRLVIRYERNGTLTDRDFELSRAGDGLDTVYDLDAGVKDGEKLTKFKPLDLLKVLEDAYNAVFGDGEEEDDEDEAPKPAPKPRKRSAAASRIAGKKAEPEPEEDDEDEAEDEEDEPTPAPKKRAPAKKAAAKKAAAPEPEFDPEVDDEEDDDDPDEDEPEVDEEDDDEDEGYTEDVLRSMPLGALRKVARDEFGVSTRGKTQDQIIDAIFEAGEADE